MSERTLLLLGLINEVEESAEGSADDPRNRSAADFEERGLTGLREMKEFARPPISSTNGCGIVSGSSSSSASAFFLRR